jgi:hypothetical protein
MSIQVSTRYLLPEINMLFTTSAFGDEPRGMLKTIRRFGKHCSCHLQGEFSTFDAVHPRKPKLYIELQPRKPKDKDK